MKSILLFFLLIPIISFSQSVLITPGAQSLNNDSTVNNQFDIYGNGLVIHEKTGVSTNSPEHINFYRNNFIFDSKDGRAAFGKIQEFHYNELGDYSFAAGFNPGAKGQAAVALGWQVRANGLSSISIGEDTKADTTNALALGRRSWATGISSTAMGFNTIASNSYTTALGYESEASGYGSIAGGYEAISSGFGSVALGSSAQATSNGAAALGQGRAYGWYSFAGGFGTAEDTAAVALGYSTNANGYASVAMGERSNADGRFSVAMGESNNVSGLSSTAFGTNNTVVGNYSFAGGRQSHSEGDYSFAYGRSSEANGLYSLAIGYLSRASADYTHVIGPSLYTNNSNNNIFYEGAFMIGDSRNGASALYANADNRFFARFRNGYNLYTDASNSVGARLLANQTAWSVISDSTRKENFIPSNGEEVLQSVSNIRIGTWNYKGQNPAEYRHWGIMAQDFYKHFGEDKIGVIGNDTTINTADFDGVAFAAIKALEERTRVLQKENEKLRNQLKSQSENFASLKDEMKELRSMLLKSVSVVSE